MKKATRLLFTVLISLYSIDSMAKTAKIDDSKDVSECIKKFKNENIECLDDALHNSEEQLNKAYLAKLNKIKKTSPDQWWMGDEEQKKEAIDSFMANQKKWIEYRDSFCGVALWSYQNSDHLGEAQTSCEINMNKRRLEEISLIQIPSEMEGETP
ncbi:lysozyme inhibitor LprI family protein [Pseudescherichia vulneris]|uniref:lysozyme inhibitor LprI family protein n=1 Tax=Pseudescherichia vulneris TaxID=566 RepID=UPI0028D2756B|nr:lysozyme inhibitor LprI family protein [Pseudescherichia vulneris]